MNSLYDKLIWKESKHVSRNTFTLRSVWIWIFFILYVCEFPTHFSEFACPDLKLEFYWGFHSALKFHSNHLHYACLTPVIISIFSTTSSIEFGGKFRVKLHRKVLWGPKTSKTNCYGWWLLVLIGCFKRENRRKRLRFQLACYKVIRHLLFKWKWR